MSLSDQERSVLSRAGTAKDQPTRGKAVAIALSKSGDELAEARALLAESFAATIQPSFHLIPRGSAMASEMDFLAAYNALDRATKGFSDVTLNTLEAALLDTGAALAPLRMIIGFTHNELAAAIRHIDPEASVSGNALKILERRDPPGGKTAVIRRKQLIVNACTAVLAVMEGQLLTVPPASEPAFHSKLDKRDTREGWSSVARDAQGVPYSALLYQRYVGGVWRQVKMRTQR